MGYFGGQGRVQKLFLGFQMTFFLGFDLFLLYHEVLSFCGWWWMVTVVFPVITLSQTNYSYGCFVVGVVVVVGL